MPRDYSDVTDWIVVGHWTVNGVPACQSELTLKVSESGKATFCACTQEQFREMSAWVRAVFPDAMCNWHPTKCPGPVYYDGEDV